MAQKRRVTRRQNSKRKTWIDSDSNAREHTSPQELQQVQARPERRDDVILVVQDIEVRAQELQLQSGMQAFQLLHASDIHELHHVHIKVLRWNQ